MTYRITTVCLGNICRSPMAEAVLRARINDAGLADQVDVSSAGTDGWHVGEDADPRALATLREAGYDLDHRGRQFLGDWHDPAHPDYGDLVLAMDSRNYATLIGMAFEPVHHRVRMMRSFDPALAGIPDGNSRLDVPDPWYGGIDDFIEVLGMLERASEGLVARLPDLMAQQ